MNIDEINKHYYLEDFNKLYKQNKDKIIEMLKNSTEEFSVIIDEIPFEEIKNKKNNSNYQYTGLLKIENNKIIVPFITKELINDIKKYLSKNIKKIKIPKELLEIDNNILNYFNNIESLLLDSIDEDTLEIIYSKTKIKNIFLEYYYHINKENGMIVENNNHIGLYKDIIVSSVKQSKSFDKLSFISKNMDFKEIERFYKLLPLKKKPSEIELYCDDFAPNYKIKIDGNNIVLYFVDNNLDNIKVLYNYFKNNGFNVEKIYIDTEHVKDLYSYDYSFLDTIGNIVKVDNHTLGLLNYTEFKSQVEGIKWFKQIIIQNNLSPLEKIIFAYDILKTFRYKDTDASHDISRNPGKILNSDYIVCIGYVEVLNEILRNIDNNIKHIDISVTCYDKNGKYRGEHARSLVYVDDDKYDIHGSYILDSTWDSTKDHKGGKEEYGNDYNALDLYRYFLVPMCDYKKVFPYDSVPSIFKNEELNKNINAEKIDEYKKEYISKKQEIEEGKKKHKFFVSFDDPEEQLLGYAYKKIFENKSGLQILDSFKNKRISFSKLLEAIRNTRLHEGFTLENIDKEIEKVSRINAPFYDDGFVLTNESVCQIK